MNRNKKTIFNITLILLIGLNIQFLIGITNESHSLSETNDSALSTNETKVNIITNTLDIDDASERINNIYLDKNEPKELTPSKISRSSSSIDTTQRIKAIEVVTAVSYTEHDTILIKNNSAFSLFATIGDGTQTDPYIINNYNITSNDSNLILIQNTTAYFTIRDNLLNGVSNNNCSGIILSNVAHGSMINNSIYNCHVGIKINSSSSDILIYNNSIFNNFKHGITLEESVNITILNNKVFNNTVYGIGLYPFSSGNTISDNLVYDNHLDGIYLKNATDNFIHSNTVYNNSQCGVILWYYAENNLIENNTIYWNEHDGIYVNSSNNIIVGNNMTANQHGSKIVGACNNTLSNNYIYNNLYPGISLREPSYNNTIENNIIDNNHIDCGILLWTCSNNRIIGNNLTNNIGSGIWLYLNSDNNTIENNYCYNNKHHGIRLSNSTHNTLSNNYTYNSTYSGIRLQYSYNNIIENNIVDNNQYDSGILFWTCSNNSIVANCITNNIGYGIWLYLNSDNNTIENNYSYNNTKYGIGFLYSNHNIIRNNNMASNQDTAFYIYQSHDNIVEGNYLSISPNYCMLIYSSNNNSIFDNTLINSTTHGAHFIYSDYNSFSNNYIFEVGLQGIYAYYSDYNVFSCNTITNSNDSGIYSYRSNSNTVSQNIITNCKYLGIYINYSPNNSVFQNVIKNASYNGLSIYYSDNVTISQNKVSNSSNHGLYMYNSKYGIITNNTIFHSLNEGIYLTNTAINNSIKWNDFIENSYGSFNISQAVDEGANNTFAYNYWSDWVTPDVDSNGIVDIPYIINGTAGNIDQFPLTSLSDQLTIPTIIYPIEYLYHVYSGIVTIQWTESLDLINSTVFYNVSYSDDNGDNWYILATGLTTLSYDWDTTTCNDGLNYLVRIVADNSFGSTAESISTDTFMIQNLEPTEPVIIYPLEGLLSGIVTIQWTESIDSLGLPITYDVSYSDDYTNWNYLATGLTTLSYDWDTTTLSDGSYYFIKIDAMSYRGLKNVDISGGLTIKNQLPTLPTIIYPNGGETLSGTVTIQWTESIDSLDLTVIYDVFYSDNGVSWNLLASNLTIISYDWDTTNLNDGSNYLIKIVAKNSFGMSSEDVSNNVFTIQNEDPDTSTSTSTSTSTNKTSSFSELGLIISLISVIIVQKRREHGNK